MSVIAMALFRIINGDVYEVEAVTLKHAEYEFHKFQIGQNNTVKKVDTATDISLIEGEESAEALRNMMDGFDRSLADD